MQRLTRQRRRAAARRNPSAFKSKERPDPLEDLGSETLKIAEELLQELELNMMPMTIYAFAKRVGITIQLLCQHANVYDRLTQHNSRCSTSNTNLFEMQLQDLREQGRVVSQKEFAKLCGISHSALLRNYSAYLQRLNEQNRTLHNERIRGEAERRLRELQTSAKGQTVREFAKSLGIDRSKLRAQLPDIVHKLVQHNKAVGLLAKSYQERDIAEQTEGRLATAFVEIERSNKVATIQDFAALAGVPWRRILSHYPHWKEHLSEHNGGLVSARLQAAWDRMEHSGTIWTCKRLAAEAEISPKLLKQRYNDWIERLKRKTTPTIERVRTAVEKAKRSSKLVSITAVAEEVGLSETGLMRGYPVLAESLVEHNKIAFRPIVEAAWETVCETHAYPTLSEFAELCNLRSPYILRAYFPDVAERVKIRLQSKEE